MSDRQKFFDSDPVIQRLRLGRTQVAVGWCKGDYVVDDKVCTLGGLGYTRDRHGDADIDETGRTAMMFLRRSLPAEYRPKAITPIIPSQWVACFNDEPERTQSDILALFDRAITLRMAELTVEVR